QSLILPVVWALTILLFFSFSSRLEYYTVPAFPALALLAGRQCDEYWERKNWPGRVLAIVGALFGVALLALAAASGAATGDAFLQLKDNPDLYTYYLGHLFDLTPESLRALRLPLLLAGVSFGVFLPLHHRIKPPMRKAATLAIGMGVFFVAANLGFLVFAPRLTSKAIADEISRRITGDDIIIIDGEYEEGCSAAFYTQRAVMLHNGRSSNLEYGSRYADAPPLFPDSARLRQMWMEDRQRIFLLTFEAKRERIESLLPEKRYALARYGDKILLSNRPDE
ncbi:MAG: hypothetical protein ACREEM_24460, partial [Blastocatellia bacterium]